MGRVLQGPWARRRPRRPAVWADLWPDLAVLPTPDQEAVIADLVSEISRLRVGLGRKPIGDRAAWLLGFVGRLDADLWPPADLEAYQKIWRSLKEAKTQIIKRQRRDNRITPAQLRLIWATVRGAPHMDRDILYRIIREEFPRARKPGPDGRAVPSLSSMTRAEARRLIDIIKPGGRRAAR